MFKKCMHACILYIIPYILIIILCKINCLGLLDWFFLFCDLTLHTISLLFYNMSGPPALNSEKHGTLLTQLTSTGNAGTFYK